MYATKKKKVDLGSEGSFDIRKGSLHEMLHIPLDEKIPESRLKSAENSASPLERKRANLAETMKKWKKR